MKLIGAGDNVVDYYLDRNEIFPGGNALNVAVLSKQTGAEQTGYIGILGNDGPAAHIIETLKKEQVDITRIRQAFGENGMAKVELNDEGDRIFVGSNQGGVQKSLTLHFTDEDLAYIRQFDILHTSVYSRIEHQLPKLHQIIDISFDFSTKMDDDYLDAVCPYTKIAFFSGSHLTELDCWNFAQKVHQYGTEIVGITRGSKGAFLSADNHIFEQPVIPTEAVDTLGAGDTFIAAFLTHYYNGSSIEQSMEKAAEAAAETCTQYGAFGHGLFFTSTV
ncbi:PfkB family carbohydrate kinase [Scopulibacillus cellulosilyticus]|uniref:PfkB family carbohydrate kinase n=1 Tax=Scopulibacillus cellulosilyticus TaxID=2665665 RepID=A0ABW2PZ45_9BACL